MILVDNVTAREDAHKNQITNIDTTKNRCLYLKNNNNKIKLASDKNLSKTNHPILH